MHLRVLCQRGCVFCKPILTDLVAMRSVSIRGALGRAPNTACTLKKPPSPNWSNPSVTPPPPLAWHLGHTPHPFPDKHGFDETGLPYSNDMWPWHYGDQDRGLIGNPIGRTCPSSMAPKPLRPTRGKNHSHRDTPSGTRLYRPKKDGPFLLYFAYSHPHVPIAASDKFKGSTGEGLYADMIAEIDDSVGQVVTSSKNSACETTRLSSLPVTTAPDTLWQEAGETGCVATRARPLRVASACPASSPCPAPSPPGRSPPPLPPRWTSSPRLRRLTGAELPSRKIDGHNILPLLKARQTRARTRRSITTTAANSVRVGDGSCTPATSGARLSAKAGRAPRQQAYPVIEQSLFNLKDDIGETTNVADQHPEVVERLLKVVEQARSELGDRLTKRQGSEVRRTVDPPNPDRAFYMTVLRGTLCISASPIRSLTCLRRRTARERTDPAVYPADRHGDGSSECMNEHRVGALLVIDRRGDLWQESSPNVISSAGSSAKKDPEATAVGGS